MSKNYKKQDQRRKDNRQNRSTRRNDSRVDNKCTSKVPEEAGSSVDATGNYNDPSYYTYDDKIAQQVYSYSYEVALGEAVQLTERVEGSTIGGLSVQMPTVAVYQLQSSVGNLDAVNQCALRTYTALSAANSKTTKYQPQDITMIMLALGDIISMHSYLRMVLGLVPKYSVRNRTLPGTLIGDYLGINFDDLRENYTDYVVQLNFATIEAAKIPFPGGIKYFDACRDLYSCIFSDDIDNPMAQLYVPKPAAVWLFDEAYNEQGSGLRTTPLQPKTNFPVLLNLLNQMIHAVVTSSTLNFVYPDVVRYLSNVSGASSWSLPTTEFGYLTDIQGSDEFFLQFNNACVMDGFNLIKADGKHTLQNDVECDVNKLSIKYQPLLVEKTGPSFAVDHMLSFYKADPSLADKVSAVRFVGAVSSAKWDATNKYFTPTQGYEFSLPDHVIRVIDVYKGGDAKPKLEITATSDPSTWTVDQLALVAAFYGFIRMPIYSKPNETTGACSLLSYTSDPRYYTFLPYNVIQNINSLRTYSLYTMK